MFKKRLLCALLALVMTLPLAACGKTKDGGAADAEGAQETVADGQEADVTPDVETPSVEPMRPGVLYQLNLDEGEPEILRGLRITGNKAGSEEFNNKASAVEGIRTVFELNETVEIYPDSDVTDGVQVFVFKSPEQPVDYSYAMLEADTPGVVQTFELRADPEDAEKPWASFSLKSGENEAGNYDVVFSFDGETIASMLFTFYNENELQGKTDAELQQLMAAQQ